MLMRNYTFNQIISFFWWEKFLWILFWGTSDIVSSQSELHLLYILQPCLSVCSSLDIILMWVYYIHTLLMVVPSMWMETMQIVARHMTVPIGSEVLCIKSSLLMRISMLVLLRGDTISERTGCSLECSSDEILVFLHHSVGDLDTHIHIMISRNNKLPCSNI